ncbi:MAG: helix-turn-helix domain-containing protein [Tepidisphaeraceae bacterium]
MIIEHYIPVSRSTLYEMISKGTFPAASIQIGRKQRLWLRDNVEDWVTSAQSSDGKGALNVA